MGRLRDKVILITGARRRHRLGGRRGGRAQRRARGRRPISRAATGIDHRARRHLGGRLAARHRTRSGSAGRLDGLVNAAGIAAIGTVEDTDFATWRRVMAINLDGTFLGCKYAMPLLMKRAAARS